MAFLKTWSLLPLAALLLLSIVPTVAEVVTSMSDCKEFLLNETPPRVPGILEGGHIQDQNRYKPICQTFNDTRRFVTLYDTKNKIPVFSAYRYNGTCGSKSDRIWMIEPQLESERNMRRADKAQYTHQAVDKDYTYTGYTKGHLYPCFYGFTKTDKESTCTMTNIVPQVGTFNSGSWNNMETCTRCVLNQYCINNNNAVEAFLVTGAQPGNNTLNNTLDGVNIPSMLWSAFCCYSSTEEKWLAGAFWGENSAGPEYLQTKTLEELHNELSTTGSVFEVFPGSQCPLKTTVTQVYPNLNSNCKCPPLIPTTSAAPTTTSSPLTTTLSQQNSMWRKGRCILHNINKFNTFPSDIRCHCNYPSISQQARCCRRCSRLFHRRVHSDG